MNHLCLAVALLTWTWTWTALAKWGPLIKLDQSSYLYTVYADPATRYTYFQYVRLPKSYNTTCDFGIRRLKAGGMLEPFQVLLQDAGERCKENMVFPRDFIGNAEGTRLFSAMQVLRNVDSKIVGNEIALQESADQGKTWSSPVYIKRKDTKEIELRYYPRFLLVKETGRLYMFYILAKLVNKQTKTYIACITREKNSASFSNERVLLDLEGPDISVIIPQMNAEYSYDVNKNFLLHLMWTGRDNKIYYAKSKDDGLTWSSSRALAQIPPYKGPGLHSLILLTTSGQLFLAYKSTQGMGYLLGSEDHGESWQSVGNFTDGKVALLDISSAKCGGRLWLGSSDGKGELRVTGYDPSTRQFTKVSALELVSKENIFSRSCLACMGDGRLWFGDTLDLMEAVYAVNTGPN